MSGVARRHKINVTVTANGDFFLVTTACRTGTVTVDGTGTVTIGREDAAGVFVPYTNGVVDAGGKLVNHGLGERLAFNVAGIASTIVVGYAPGC